MGLSVIGRIMLRRGSIIPPQLPFANKTIEKPLQYLAKFTHYSLYGFLIFMPITGITMSIFGGSGVPFFDFFSVPGLKNKNKEMAEFFWKIHVLVGQTYVYGIIPLHITGGFVHGWSGLARIL